MGWLWRVRVVAFMILAFFASTLQAAVPPLAQEANLEGNLMVLNSEPLDGPAQTHFYLQQTDGSVTNLAIPDAMAAEMAQLGGRIVRVSGSLLQPAEGAGDPKLAVASYSTLGAPAAAVPDGSVVSGTLWYKSLLCMFPYKNVPYTWQTYEEIYGSGYPKMNHYWTEVSGGALTITGRSTDWGVLPHEYKWYLDSNNDGKTDDGRIGQLIVDCATIHYSSIDTSLWGLSFFFNDSVPGAPGWSSGITIGQKLYRYVLMNNNINASIMAHEMGHNFGRDHSECRLNADYDNVWDVMSNDGLRGYGCTIVDPKWGCVPQHPLAAAKDAWWGLPKLSISSFPASFFLERSAQPTSSNYQLAKIPLACGQWTLEARKQVGYDAVLPGEGVLVHWEPISTPECGSRHKLQIFDRNGDCDTRDANLPVGSRTRIDPANDIWVEVDMLAPTGFGVTVYKNRLPVVADDTVTTQWPNPVYIYVMDNDSDPDHDPLVLDTYTQPQYGSILTDGESFYYTPGVSPTGTDSFTYTLSDGRGGTATATVHITMTGNIPPVARADGYSIPAGRALAVAAPGILANDQDANGDILAAVKVTDPAHGTLSLNANGSFTYQSVATYLGTDSFTYKVSDGKAESAAATVTINVLPTMTVASPNGGQKWLRDRAYRIRWRSNQPGGTVAIKLMRGVSVYKTIKNAAPNTGSFLWRVPVTLAPGSRYKVKIIRNGTGVFDQSDKPFTIY